MDKDKEDLAFWERLRDGQTCEVLNEENILIFLGKIRLTDKKAVVEVAESSGRPVPPVLYNTKLKLKLYFSEIGAQLLEGEVCGSTQYFWRLDHLRPLHGREKRGSFRQRVSIPSNVLCVNSIYNPGNTSGQSVQRSTRCHLEDLSLGGLLLRCRKQFACEDWLLVMDVNLLSRPPFVFTGQVRWMEEARPGEYLYGCEFADLVQKEQDRLFQAIFELQRMDVQSRRRDR